MAILNKNWKKKQVIDLTGSQGNAFYILSVAEDLSKRLCKDWKAIRDEMTSGNYENLIAVFDREFGHLVDLER